MRDQHFRSYICINEHKRTPSGFKNPTGFYFAAPPFPRRAAFMRRHLRLKKPQMRAFRRKLYPFFAAFYCARNIAKVEKAAKSGAFRKRSAKRHRNRKLHHSHGARRIYAAAFAAQKAANARAFRRKLYPFFCGVLLREKYRKD